MAKKTYIWQQSGWPRFTWDASLISSALANARRLQGRLQAKAVGLNLEIQAQIVTDDAQKTAAIEGEKLNYNSIRSSVARRLGLSAAGLPQPDRQIDGLVEMLLDASRRYDMPLTFKRLHQWHAAIFPTGQSGLHKIVVGNWRKNLEPMVVVSGPVGKERIHYEAPPAKFVKTEMQAFIAWFSNKPSMDGLLRAAIAHLWFITIHPFEDGNGRIARAITDLALAQDDKMELRFYSLSSQISLEREAYYSALERTQKGSLDITEWLIWFLEIYSRALSSAELIIDKTFFIGKFWQDHALVDLNSRQKKALQKMLESEPIGFVGGMTNRKYVSLTKTSRETAKRDLSDLEEKGILKRNEGKGRSVSYHLVNRGSVTRG